MFGVKIQMYVGLIGAASAFMSASSMFSTVKKCTKSSSYYWSRDVRDVATIMDGIGIFPLFIGAILLGVGFSAVILIKFGKFCPGCEKVFFKFAVKCPKCKADSRNAKSVKAYLLEKPRTMPKGTAEMNNRKLIGRPYSGNKRFCAYCGKGLTVEAAFCLYCGNKANQKFIILQGGRKCIKLIGLRNKKLLV